MVYYRAGDALCQLPFSKQCTVNSEHMGGCRSISPLYRRGANAPGCNYYIIHPERRGAFFIRVGSQRFGAWSGLSAPISSRTDSSGIEDGSAALARQERRGGVFCPLRTAYRRLSASLWSRGSLAEAPALVPVGRWSNLVDLYNRLSLLRV